MTTDVGIFLDETLWTVLENTYNAFTTEQKINMVALKWNGVRLVFTVYLQNGRQIMLLFDRFTGHLRDTDKFQFNSRDCVLYKSVVKMILT